MLVNLRILNVWKVTEIYKKVMSDSSKSWVCNVQDYKVLLSSFVLC